MLFRYGNDFYALISLEQPEASETVGLHRWADAFGVLRVSIFNDDEEMLDPLAFPEGKLIGYIGDDYNIESSGDAIAWDYFSTQDKRGSGQALIDEAIKLIIIPELHASSKKQIVDVESEDPLDLDFDDPQ